MLRGESQVSLTSWEAALKGFLAGALVIGGILGVEFGLPVQGMLFVVGLVIFLEAIIPSNKNMHGLTAFAFMLLGAVASFAASVSGAAAGFLIVAFILVVLLYVRHILTGLHVLNK